MEVAETGYVSCYSEPLSEQDPTPEAGAALTIALPRHGLSTHQDATPAAFILGDANGDGQVTVTDAVAVVDYTRGQHPAGFNETAADVSGDGYVTATDAVLILNLILSDE